DNEDLEQHPLFQDTLMLLCRLDHPLASARTITWKKVLPHRLINLRSNSSVRQLVDAAYHEYGNSSQPGFEVENASTVVAFVSYGLGVAVLPLSLIPPVRAARLTYRRITQPELRRTICITTLRGRSLSPSASAFCDICMDIAASGIHAGDGKGH